MPLDLQKRWIWFVQVIGNLSSFWQTYSSSESFEVHCITLIETFEISTISKYVGTLQSLSTLLTDFKLSWEDMGTYKIADLLQMAREGRSTDLGFGASSVVRALRWAQRLLDIDISHWSNLYSPLVSAFTVRSDGDRTEAVPLSLFVVLSWEKRILSRDCPLHELIVLGGLLIILWGGLRFSDGQRVPLQSLAWSITALRGTCKKTKTTKPGQPWAVQSCGFLSFGSCGWVVKWLMALDGLWSTHSNPGDPQDFLLPMTCGTKFSQPLIPMSYSQTLKWLRYFCTIPWRHSQFLPISAPHNHTAHSLKSTTLSWAAQLAQQGHVTEEQRHLQGHHRRGSVRLYSRDDTAGQLALQATLVLQVRKGYRFVTPLHRGSQTPSVEPAVTLEGYRKEYPEFRWSFFNFNHSQRDPFVQGFAASVSKEPLEVGSDSDSSSSSASSSSCTTSTAKRRGTQNNFQNESQWMFACHTRVQHIMIPCDDSTQPSINGIHFRAACGVRLPSDSCKFQDSVDPKLARCRHSGCCVRWDYRPVDLKKKNRFYMELVCPHITFKAVVFYHEILELFIDSVHRQFPVKEARLATSAECVAIVPFAL